MKLLKILTEILREKVPCIPDLVCFRLISERVDRDLAVVFLYTFRYSRVAIIVLQSGCSNMPFWFLNMFFGSATESYGTCLTMLTKMSAVIVDSIFKVTVKTGSHLSWNIYIYKSFQSKDYKPVSCFLFIIKVVLTQMMRSKIIKILQKATSTNINIYLMFFEYLP